jgi:hypothetical protein
MQVDGIVTVNATVVTILLGQWGDLQNISMALVLSNLTAVAGFEPNKSAQVVVELIPDSATEVSKS